jgi:diguanylate cyclase (GGDEF)-like protein
MERHHFFVNKDGQLCVAKVVASTALLVALVAALLPAITQWATSKGIAPVLASAVFAVIVLVPLFYLLIIAPIRRAYAGRVGSTGPAEDKSQFVTIDSLTHTLNRRGVTSTLLEAMAQAQRYNNALSIALVDIDGLARINDKQGFQAGNKTLELVASTITEVLRLPDRVGRQGDDDFLVVMPQTKAAAATKVAERIRGAIEALDVEFGNQSFKVSISVGVAEFHKGQDLERFLSDAQAALQLAKRGDGNRVMRHKVERRK